jgi:hypothetical protein
METVRFNQVVCLNEWCDIRSAVYCCSKHGSQSGEYVKAEEARVLEAENARLKEQLSQRQWENDCLHDGTKHKELAIVALKSQLAELRAALERIEVTKDEPQRLRNRE